MNRLAYEKSPYLLQHSENPVNWYPWCDEAFKKAKTYDKPVFLSIGYSTCHWCHVMERESFEDEGIAEILNNGFVSIKVDREERPDIDSVYMAVCQALSGSGGWPLTIIMTPDKKPFYAGTYLPKNGSPGWGAVGLTELLNEVLRLWKEDRSGLVDAGDKISEFFESREAVKTCEPSKRDIRKGAAELYHRFDRRWGGFGTAPKFPTPHNLLFLMQYGKNEDDQRAFRVVYDTLDNMYRGGIFDHIGGGFSRYSTDIMWLIPHFEKMLYDNALLVYTYAEAYKISGKALYNDVCSRIIDYVLTELTDEKGGFFCGQDADSDGEEGKYYAFTKEEVISQLGDVDGRWLCEWFGITDEGNFEGKSIPNLINNERYVHENQKIKQLSAKLYDYRKMRTHINTDDKILTSWNAMMIAALSNAGLVFKEQKYIDAAVRAETFISERLTDMKGELYVRYRDGEAAYNGNIDDYAFYGFSLIWLYQATLDVKYLKRACEIADKMTELFFDYEDGGFYMYSKNSEKLMYRPKEVYDGAIPSGNSAAAWLVVKLWQFTGDIKWRELSQKQLSFLAYKSNDYPSGNSFSLIAMSEMLYKNSQIVCVSSDNAIPEELKDFLAKNTFYGVTVLFKSPENQERLSETVDFTSAYKFPESGALYYLCTGGSCMEPVCSLSEIKDKVYSYV